MVCDLVPGCLTHLPLSIGDRVLTGALPSKDVDDTVESRHPKFPGRRCFYLAKFSIPASPPPLKRFKVNPEPRRPDQSLPIHGRMFLQAWEGFPA